MIVVVVQACLIFAQEHLLIDFEDYIVLPPTIKATEQNLFDAQNQMQTYIEVEEDFELAQTTAKRIEELSALLDKLKADYANLMKNI